MEVFCLKEKKFVNVEDGKNETDKKGRLVFTGTCPSCGNQVRRYLSKENVWKK